MTITTLKRDGRLSSRTATTPESRHRPAVTPGARAFFTFEECLSHG